MRLIISLIVGCVFLTFPGLQATDPLEWNKDAFYINRYGTINYLHIYLECKNNSSEDIKIYNRSSKPFRREVYGDNYDYCSWITVPAGKGTKVELIADDVTADTIEAIFSYFSQSKEIKKIIPVVLKDCSDQIQFTPYQFSSEGAMHPVDFNLEFTNKSTDTITLTHSYRSNRSLVIYTKVQGKLDEYNRIYLKPNESCSLEGVADFRDKFYYNRNEVSGNVSGALEYSVDGDSYSLSGIIPDVIKGIIDGKIFPNTHTNFRWLGINNDTVQTGDTIHFACEITNGEAVPLTIINPRYSSEHCNDRDIFFQGSDTVIVSAGKKKIINGLFDTNRKGKYYYDFGLFLEWKNGLGNTVYERIAIPKLFIKADQYAELTFHYETYDAGEYPMDAPDLEVSFPFTNTGNIPLQMTDIRSSCGCLVPSGPKEPIMPGETNFIHGKYNSSQRPGAFNKSIRVTFNSLNCHTVLFIKGYVVPSDSCISNH